MTPQTRPSWRIIAAGLPAVALIGGGVALAATGGHPDTHIVAESKPVVTVPSNPLDLPAAPPLPELPAPPEQAPTTFGAQAGGLPTSMSANGIPAQALAAYQRAAQLVDAADQQCKIDWALIGAIGKVESNHGRYGGNGIDSNGTVRPGIYGIPLNGANNTAVVHDTDNGVLDRDTVWDRAVGPMQFIPSTWRVVGVDATGSGVKDPQNMSDAATAAAVYLCAGPGDLSTDSGARSAVMRYNHSQAYVDEVMAIAAAYRGGYTVIPDTGLTPAQQTDAPYMPSGDPQTMATYNAVQASQPAGASGTAAKPAGGTKASSGSSGTGSGTVAGGGTSGGTTPGGTTGGVGGVLPSVTSTLNTVVGGVTNPTPAPLPAPTTTSVPAPTPSVPAPTPTLLLGKLVCPSPWTLVLNVCKML